MSVSHLPEFVTTSASERVPLPFFRFKHSLEDLWVSSGATFVLPCASYSHLFGSYNICFVLSPYAFRVSWVSDTCVIEERSFVLFR